MIKEFYVYIYCDQRCEFDFKFENVELRHKPFYVGKGSGYRFRHHLSSGSLSKKSPKSSKIKSILKKTGEEPKIILIRGLSEVEALKLENRLIKELGRKYVDGGVLVNMSEGGLNDFRPSGTYRHSKETKEKLTGPRISLQKENHPMWGKQHTEDTKIKISKSMRQNKKPHFLNSMTESDKEVWINKNLKGENNPNYGKPQHINTKEALSKIDRAKDKNPFFGKSHSDKSKNLMRISVIRTNLVKLKNKGLELNKNNFNSIKSRNCPRYENISWDIIQ